jgi:hypothetical protein
MVNIKNDVVYIVNKSLQSTTIHTAPKGNTTPVEAKHRVTTVNHLVAMGTLYIHTL